MGATMGGTDWGQRLGAAMGGIGGHDGEPRWGATMMTMTMTMTMGGHDGGQRLGDNDGALGARMGGHDAGCGPP